MAPRLDGLALVTRVPAGLHRRGFVAIGRRRRSSASVVPGDPGAHRLWFPVVTFAGLLVAAFLVGHLSTRYFPVEPPAHRWPDHRWLGNFARWDSGWYWHIATDGYFYDGPTRQSAVAFFPAYPFAMRLTARVIPGDLIVAGVLLTVLSGFAVAVLFFEWCRSAFGTAAARYSLLLLFLYPFAFYFFGAVYADTLFLAAALGAFLLLESDHPILAGVVGAFATAARPVGIALVVGLALRTLELRGVLPGARARLLAQRPGTGAHHRGPLVPPRPRRGHLRLADAGVLLSLIGFGAFCGLLWWRFGEPLAFMKVEAAEGWNRRLDVRSLAMLQYFRLVRSYGLTIGTFALTVQGVVSVVVIGVIPMMIRRLGWGYAAYVVVAVALPLLSSSDFFGMGRYALVAFPAFAVVGAALASKQVWSRSLVLAANGMLLLFFTSLFARWYLLA